MMAKWGVQTLWCQCTEYTSNVAGYIQSRPSGESSIQYSSSLNIINCFGFVWYLRKCRQVKLKLCWNFCLHLTFILHMFHRQQRILHGNRIDVVEQHPILYRQFEYLHGRTFLFEWQHHKSLGPASVGILYLNCIALYSIELSHSHLFEKNQRKLKWRMIGDTESLINNNITHHCNIDRIYRCRMHFDAHFVGWWNCRNFDVIAALQNLYTTVLMYLPAAHFSTLIFWTLLRCWRMQWTGRTIFRCFCWWWPTHNTKSLQQTMLLLKYLNHSNRFQCHFLRLWTFTTAYNWVSLKKFLAQRNRNKNQLAIKRLLETQKLYKKWMYMYVVLVVSHYHFICHIKNIRKQMLAS